MFCVVLREQASKHSENTSFFFGSGIAYKIKDALQIAHFEWRHLWPICTNMVFYFNPSMDK